MHKGRPGNLAAFLFYSIHKDFIPNGEMILMISPY